MSEDVMRAFVAVRPTPARRSLIAETVRRRTEADAVLREGLRLVPPGRLHLTLAFLGTLPVARAADLCDATRHAATTVEPFELGFAVLGGFPHVARARVAWLDVREGCEPLTSLANALRSALADDDLPFDAKPFRPHLTVARSRRGPVDLPTTLDLRIPPFEVDEIEVVRSQLGPKGAAHRTLARGRLGRAATPDRTTDA